MFTNYTSVWKNPATVTSSQELQADVTMLAKILAQKSWSNSELCLSTHLGPLPVALIKLLGVIYGAKYSSAMYLPRRGMCLNSSTLMIHEANGNLENEMHGGFSSGQ